MGDHSLLITDLNKMVQKQISQHNGREYICKRCFVHFDERPVAMVLSGAQRLDEHRRYCKEHAPLRTDLPVK